MSYNCIVSNVPSILIIFLAGFGKIEIPLNESSLIDVELQADIHWVYEPYIPLPSPGSIQLPLSQFHEAAGVDDPVLKKSALSLKFEKLVLLPPPAITVPEASVTV